MHYSQIGGELGRITHARRKFMDAKKVHGKGQTGKSDMVLAKINELYWLETLLKGVAVRNAKLSMNGKRSRYWQWPKLVRYVDDGYLIIDNNRA